MASLSNENEAQIVRGNIFNRQVCVPKDWTAEQASQFLNSTDPAGTTNGWVFNVNLGEVTCAEDPSKKHLCFHV
jgi:hypothetical protein